MKVNNALMPFHCLWVANTHSLASIRLVGIILGILIADGILGIMRE